MGINSTALLVGLHDRGIRPDLITCADTGGERPDTYEYLDYFSKWCRSVGFPAITVVRRTTREGAVETLEDLSLRKHMLPSLAYGFKTCSEKFKIRPQNKFMNHWEPAVVAWNTCLYCGLHRRQHKVIDRKRWCEDGTAFFGGKVIKMIGYDAGELRRAKMTEDGKFIFQFPLIEWGWGRDECIDAINAAGVKVPGKSSCFFCPAMKKPELVQLQTEYPDLVQRAVAMERNAHLTSIKGLGRSFAWESFFAAKEDERACLIPVTNDVPCGCYDEGEV
jgi:hypothetical protein